MGVIISRFRKKSAVDQLEDIEEEIKELEACSADTKLRHQKITKQLLIYSSGLCLLFAVLLYFYIPPKLETKIILITLLLLSPLIYYIGNKIISWYYKRKISSSHSRLKELRKEKQRLIDEIMDKETYKVAKEILEKYAPEALPQKYPTRFGTGSPVIPPAAGNMRNNMPILSSAGANRSQPMTMMNQAYRPNFNSRAPNPRRSSQLALPVPLRPQVTQSFIQNKGLVERMFEYLVGDGPNNRYALICSNCSTHNGMALQEEFEYTAFKCYACFTLNPARKQRPIAPKLEGERSDRDTPEPDSCSSSVSGEHGNVRIEEVEDLEKEENEDGDSDSRVAIEEVTEVLEELELQIADVEEDLSRSVPDEQTSRGTFDVKESSGANSESEEEPRRGTSFTKFTSSTDSDNLKHRIVSSDGSGNGDA